MGHGGHHVMIHNWQRPRGLTLLLPDLVCMKRIPFLDLLETRRERVERTLLIFTGLLLLSDEGGVGCGRHKLMGNTIRNTNGQHHSQFFLIIKISEDVQLLVILPPYEDLRNCNSQ